MENNILVNNLHIKVNKAYKHIYEICKKTDLEISDSLSKIYNCSIYLKHEYQQYTGSFKLRGATNKLYQISEEINHINNDKLDEKININIITASTGNHGSGVSYACNKMNKKFELNSLSKINKFNCTVFAPNNVDYTKENIILSYNSKLVKVDSNDCLEAEEEAVKFLQKCEMLHSFYISPYNDIDVIAGQGTLGKEIMEQFFNNENEKKIKKIDAIFISVGGGGLISGVGAYLKSENPDCKIIACQPENSKIMFESIEANTGKVLQNLQESETISDATAGNLDENSITYNYIKRYVDDFVLATEEEIKDALKILIKNEKIIVEGSAALTLACFIKVKDNWVGKNVVLVLCGKNINYEKLKDILK